MLHIERLVGLPSSFSRLPKRYSLLVVAELLRQKPAQTGQVWQPRQCLEAPSQARVSCWRQLTDLTDVGMSRGPHWCTVVPSGLYGSWAPGLLLHLPAGYIRERFSAKVEVAAVLWAEEQLQKVPWLGGSALGLWSEVPGHSLPSHLQLRHHLATVSSWVEPLPQTRFGISFENWPL